MASNVYVTAMEPQSGKSVVALGLMETLSSRVERLGYFRPIVPSGPEPDSQVELMRRRYRLSASHDEMQAQSDEEAQAAIAAGDRDELKKEVVAAYRQLERNCDVVVCEGSDFDPSAPALDFGLDAELANELGSPVLAVVRGDSADDALGAVRVARESLAQRGCELFGVIVNRVPAAALPEVTEALAADEGPAVYVLPERPELAHPTVAEVAAALGARPLVEGPERRKASWTGGSVAAASSTEELLQREVRGVRVAAMSVEHFIDDLVEGTLVIVPGDRPDILVASIISTLSSAFGAVSGVVLTGGHELHPAVRRLLEAAPFCVLEAPSDTYAAATAVESVRGSLSADNEGKLAGALGLFEGAVDADELEQRVSLERPARITPTMFEYELILRARAAPRHIVLPEGEDDRVLRAAEILLRRGVAGLTILGDVEEIAASAGALGVDLSGARLLDPREASRRADYAATYHELRKHKGVTEELAFDTVADPSYFGTLMVHAGDADGMVSGAAHTTGDTIRPAFEVIKARKGVSVVSSVFLMCLADRVLAYGDCAVNPNPDAGQLADIAISSAETAGTFGVDPKVAMLSYSTGESGKGEDVDTVRAATEIVRERRSDLAVEGPIQYDAAVDASVAAKKLPDSEVAGRATVLVFPDLDTGNVAYKAVQRSAGAVAIGPVLQGLNKPVNDLSRGCTVTDIVNTVAITAIQAQDEGERRASRVLEAPVTSPSAGVGAGS